VNMRNVDEQDSLARDASERLSSSILMNTTVLALRFCCPVNIL
jgi:hypothetical protein